MVLVKDLPSEGELSRQNSTEIHDVFCPLQLLKLLADKFHHKRNKSQQQQQQQQQQQHPKK